MKKTISRKKADALVKGGAKVTITDPAPPQRKKRAAKKAEPAPGPVFSKDDIKDIMIEAMKIANRHERRGRSRLEVNRDTRGFIATVDIIPVDDPVTLN